MLPHPDGLVPLPESSTDFWSCRKRVQKWQRPALPGPGERYHHGHLDPAQTWTTHRALFARKGAITGMAPTQMGVFHTASHTNPRPVVHPDLASLSPLRPAARCRSECGWVSALFESEDGHWLTSLIPMKMHIIRCRLVLARVEAASALIAEEERGLGCCIGGCNTPLICRPCRPGWIWRYACQSMTK